MAIARVPHLGRTLIMPAEIEDFLTGIGVEYERWARVRPIPGESSARKVLKVYRPELEAHKLKKNFAGYEVVELSSEASGFCKKVSEINREHWHSACESRFVLAGRGICYVHPAGQPVVSVELEPGDLITVGKGVPHWFEFCGEMDFRAIQFISNRKDECTVYTRSGIEEEYEAVYVSPTYFAYAGARGRS